LSFRQILGKGVPHGGWLFSGLVLGWLCFPGWGWCERPASPAPPPESLVSPPVSPQAVSPSKSAEETSWLPLREVIQKYSETTGNQVRIKDDKTFDQLYSVNDLSWLEDFNRIEIFDEHSRKKEIILLGKKQGFPSGPSLNAQTTRKQPRKTISRASAGAPGVSGPAGDKQRRKSKFPNIFGHRHKNKKISPAPKHP